MLFTFPSQYWFPIGLPSMFSLAEWSPLLQTGFLVSRLTQDSAGLRPGFEYGAVTRCGAPFQTLPLALPSSYRGPSTPRTPRRPGFGLFPFRSPLLGKSMFLSFPADTEMFQFSACAHPRGCMMSSTSWVVPFGSLRINSCLQIPADFRSLPRPSSLMVA